MKSMPADTVRHQLAIDRGIALEYLTVGWNVLEGIVAVLSGMWVGSIALVGFGIDSGIEERVWWSSALALAGRTARTERGDT